MDSNTPDYYKGEEGKDLYDIFLEEYGVEMLIAHMEMEVRQYIKRLRIKGQYKSDIQKVNNITRRMVFILYGQDTIQNTVDSKQLYFTFLGE